MKSSLLIIDNNGYQERKLIIDNQEIRMASPMELLDIALDDKSDSNQHITQPVFTCSNSTIETPEQCVNTGWTSKFKLIKSFNLAQNFYFSRIKKISVISYIMSNVFIVCCPGHFYFKHIIA